MRTWNFYTAKELHPEGWVRRQLEIQAEGLSGNLDKVWRDVRDSAWIGGTAEGWERVPYWLDGFIPLAYLLDTGSFRKTDIPAHRRIRNKGWYALSASQNQSNRGGSNFPID